MTNRQIRVKNVLVQLNGLLHVTQWKFNPCKHEIVCLVYSYYISGHDFLHSIDWLAKRKKKLLMILLFVCVT